MRACRSTHKFHQEKLLFPIRTQCRTGIVNHTCWAIVVIHNGRNDVSGLSIPTRFEQFFVHPNFIFIVFGIGVFAILPVGTPTCIRTLNNMYQSLAFARVVAVVIRRNQVAVFVKHKFVGVAQTVGKNFKIAAVGVGASNNTGVGMFMFFPIGSRNISANVTDIPVNASVRAFRYARHAMSAKADVNAVAVADRCFFINDSVAVAVFQSPQIRSNCHKHIFGSYQHTTRYVGDFIIKVFQNSQRNIGNAIVIGIFQAPNFVFFNGQILPIVRAVLVQIIQPRIFSRALGGKGFTQKSPTVFDGLQTDRLSHPITVPSNVKFRVFLAVGTVDIHSSLVVNGHCYGVGSQRIRRPKRHLKSISQFDCRFLANFFGIA